MTAVPATSPDISPEFVARLAERAQEAEELRRLPSATVNNFVASGFAELLVPARDGGVAGPVAVDSRSGPSDGARMRVQRPYRRLPHPALVRIRGGSLRRVGLPAGRDRFDRPDRIEPGSAGG